MGLWTKLGYLDFSIFLFYIFSIGLRDIFGRKEIKGGRFGQRQTESKGRVVLDEGRF
jgi:hypothetical protein